MGHVYKCLLRWGMYISVCSDGVCVRVFVKMGHVYKCLLRWGMYISVC